MVSNCSDNQYNIRYTDSSLNPIQVNKNSLTEGTVDIALLGKTRKEYGDIFDENVLHLLENFAAVENPSAPGTPDLTQSVSFTLSNPSIGQLWYNKTQQKLFYYTANGWTGSGDFSDIGGSSGVLADGGSIPLPVSLQGYNFSYSECCWFVSPYNFPEEIEYMECTTNTRAQITSQYLINGATEMTSGYANYIIIGIKGNTNLGTISATPVPPPITITPTPTISVSATTQAPVSPTPSPTSSRTPAITKTPAPTGTPFPTPTPTASPSLKALAATLFISPSNGYPTSSTQLTDCSTASGSTVPCEQSLSVLIQSIVGGVAPYTINFSNVFFTPTITYTGAGTTVPSSIIPTYSGGAGRQHNSVRTGVTVGASAQVNAMILPAAAFNTTQAAYWRIQIDSGSFVTIEDSSGMSINLYTPSGSEGNVIGTSYTTPQGSYQDSYFSSGS